MILDRKEKRLVEKMYKTGHDQAAIADWIGCDVGSVRAHLKVAGLVKCSQRSREIAMLRPAIVAHYAKLQSAKKVAKVLRVSPGTVLNVMREVGGLRPQGRPEKPWKK